LPPFFSGFQAAGFRTKSALKRMCKDCYFVRKDKNLYVYCLSKGTHKQKLYRKNHK
jgi:ribosomal protein L36